MKVLGAIGITLLVCVVSAQSQQREDSYMEAYHESHYPGQYYSLDDMTFRMPMEEMQNSSIIPQVMKLAALAAKILLKLTLFKIVVKFIAVVCLFLFIPKLKFQRSLDNDSNPEQYLETLAQMLKNSLKEYQTEEKKEN